MSDGDDAWAEKGPRQCLHTRLLESARDDEDKKGDVMKCCECGTLVPRPAHFPNRESIKTQGLH
jgi:hypothetical protein